MKTGKRLPVRMAAAVALLAGASVPALAQPPNDAAALAIGGKDIGGVVSGPHGREPGVWVIAETTEPGPLSGAGFAASRLRRLGARLRACRLAKDAREAG
jgi:hypothetical protein